MASRATGPTLGLDIGSAFIKVVEMRPARGSSRVSAIGIMPTPANTFAGDIISDPITLGNAIKQLLKESGISPKQVVASVSGQTGFAMRILPVPKMTTKELAESMKWEVERHVPFRPDETIQDFKPLPPINESPESNEMPVLLVVGQKQMIDSYASTLLFAGLKPVALDVEPLSLIRTVPLHEARENCLAFVNIGAAKTDIGVFDRGVMVYPRTLPIAGNNFTRAIADMLGYPTEQAERAKVEAGAIPEDRTSAASAFDDAGGAFGAFDLPDTGLGGVDDNDFGLGGPLGAAPAAEDEPQFGGFAAPADEDDGGIAFTLDDDLGNSAPSQGGFAFSLEDDPPKTAPQDDALEFPLEPDEPAKPFGATPAEEPTSMFGFEDEPEPSPFGFAEESESSPFGFAEEPAVPEPAASVPTGGGEVPIPLTEEERFRRQIGEALVPVYNDLMLEIRRSMEAYSARPNGRPVSRIYLSGGTARLKGLALALEQDLGIPVQLQDPSRNFPVAGRNVPPGYYAEVGPMIAVAIGLGIRDHVEDPAPEAKPVRKTKTAVVKA